jgi:hypothetical protein
VISTLLDLENVLCTIFFVQLLAHQSATSMDTLVVSLPGTNARPRCEQYRRVVRPSTYVVLVAASVLLGCESCAPTTSASAAPVRRPVPHAATNAGRENTTDDPTITHSQPLAIEAWTGDGSGHVLGVQFPLASPDCTGVHADVEENTNTVTVSVLEGTHPDAVGRMCTMVVVPSTLEITLQSPLGDRTVFSTP